MMVLEVVHNYRHVGIGSIEEMSGTPIIRYQTGEPLFHGIVGTAMVGCPWQFAQA